MFAGTSSGVGKSTLAAGFCRIFLQDGYRPAPFKAQNMSLNSFITPEGGEIGRAQAVQAEAAGILPHTDMNPVLLKPSGNNVSQVILRGKVDGNISAREYFREKSHAYFQTAADSFRNLESQYNPIVLEGAGGIAELNLKDRDIVNLPMAREAKAVVYLVADIERGGVFASVYGTLALLSPEERSMVHGIIINRFRGDSQLFEDGRKIIEELTGLPVLGVVPHIDNLDLEEEDSLDIEKYHDRPANGLLNIAVIRLKHVSNYTDFALLSRIPGIQLYYTSRPEFIQQADVIILPGTKNTIDDLSEIQRNGCAAAVQQAASRGVGIFGICGGYQMLGEKVFDPEGIESDIREIDGLSLLPMNTLMQYPKVTEQVHFARADAASDGPISSGYEIHMGRSTFTEGMRSLFRLVGEKKVFDGVAAGNIAGTYIHGCLDDSHNVSYLLNDIFGKRIEIREDSIRIKRQESYNRLADHIREHVDVRTIYRDLTIGIIESC